MHCPCTMNNARNNIPNCCQQTRMPCTCALNFKIAFFMHQGWYMEYKQQCFKQPRINNTNINNQFWDITQNWISSIFRVPKNFAFASHIATCTSWHNMNKDDSDFWACHSYYSSQYCQRVNTNLCTLILCHICCMKWKNPRICSGCPKEQVLTYMYIWRNCESKFPCSWEEYQLKVQ